MRPWRDIISINTWVKVLEKADSTAHMSKITALKSVFDRDIDTPSRSLDRLTQQIRLYHNLQKDEITMLHQRILLLKHISSLAKEHLARWKVDMEKAKERVFEHKKYEGVGKNMKTFTELKPIERKMETGRYEMGEAFLQSIDRNLLTLWKRSLRKAKYLEDMQAYYNNGNINAQIFMDAVQKPKESNNESTGLVPGVRLEAIDPWHRPVELKFKDGKLVDEDEGDLSATAAFTQWYKTVLTKPTTPSYFLWLENHPICTSDDKGLIYDTASVAYLDVNKEKIESRSCGAPQYKLAVLYRNGNFVVMWDIQSVSTQWASTHGYQCSSEKGVNKLDWENKDQKFNSVTDNEAAAYIWDKKGHMILIAQHQGNSFHHSSFLAGGSVNCAGMIQLRAGKVVYVSNNSGHYQPSKELLANFVNYLSQNQLFDNNAVVHCFGLKTRFKDNPKEFLTKYKSLI